MPGRIVKEWTGFSRRGVSHGSDWCALIVICYRVLYLETIFSHRICYDKDFDSLIVPREGQRCSFLFKSYLNNRTCYGSGSTAWMP